MIKLVLSDIDISLTTFPAHLAYQGAATSLATSFGSSLYPADRIYNRLITQYKALHQSDHGVVQEITRAFKRYVAHDNVPEEVGWCRFAAFTVVVQEMMADSPRTMVGFDFDAIVNAERVFWKLIADRSEPYPDVLQFAAAAERAGAMVQPFTSSDVRVDHDKSRSIDAGRVRYAPRISASMKLARVEPVLGRFMRAPVVFEEYKKRNSDGWARYMNHFTHAAIAQAAVIGDSIGDVEAGIPTGMRTRILIDRDHRYASCPEAATHLVRSLDEVPAILGW